MRNRLNLRRSRFTLVAAVLVFPVVALVMPSAWTGKLVSLAQIIVPFQSVAGSAVGAATSLSGERDESVSGEMFAKLERERTALRHRAAALAARVDELEREVEVLSASRLWDAGGQRLGSRGRLLPADVVVEDILPWRQSRLVTVGSLQGVNRGDAVISRHFIEIERGGESGVRDGMAVLLGETLVGFAEQVGTHTARVRLLTDDAVQMKVRIGRFLDDGFEPLSRYFWLRGRGGDTMEIRDAERRDVDSGVIQVGDVVLSDPASGLLPAAMTVGRITQIRPDRNNPLLSILTVKSPLDPSQLRRVYIYDPGADKDAKRVP